MQIAIVGTGAIGSAFAYQLARAGHAVTVIARGARLEQLRRDHAIVLASGEQAAVQVNAALEASTPYDLVLVTVLAPQVASVLPALRASAAHTVMFMFNTFEPLDPLRDAVGARRFAFGFPAGVFAILRDGKISPQIRSGTTVGDARWAKVFTDAGIPTVAEEDMHSWLRSHAALVIPLMAIGTVSLARGGISWREAGVYAEAMETAFAVVRDLGNIPRALGEPRAPPGSESAAVGHQPHPDVARSRRPRARRGPHADRHDDGGSAGEDRGAARHSTVTSGAAPAAVRERGRAPCPPPSLFVS